MKSAQNNGYATSRTSGRTALTLGIASKLPRETAETFIRAHMDCLPFQVRVLHGVPPHTDDRDGFIYHRGLLRSGWLKLREQFAGSDEQRLRDEAMARYFRRNRIAVVLAEYGTVGTEVMRACRRAGVPLVVHFHGADAYNSETLGEYRGRYAEMFRIASTFVAVSHDMVDQLIRLGAPPERVRYIPYWVDETRFCGARPSESPRRVLAVGRFVEKKGPHLTLFALSLVLKEMPDARLTMIGDGPLLGACQHLAEVLKIAHAVEFLGARAHSFVAEHMGAARVFVQHSVRALNGDCEGTPVAILEAQCAGLPVVATRHTGIKDVVVDGETGFLVDERDVDAMAAAIVQLLRRPDLAERLGTQGRRHVLSNFSRSDSIRKLTDLVSETANAAPPRAGADVVPADVPAVAVASIGGEATRNER